MEPFFGTPQMEKIQVDKLKAQLYDGFFHYLKRVYFDTAISATPYALPSLHALVDSAHILFGSDFPFVPPSAAFGIKENIEGLAASGIFTAEECVAIEEKNALTLFPGMAARVKGCH
jgi:6-methylsalicylate decarboxylase